MLTGRCQHADGIVGHTLPDSIAHLSYRHSSNYLEEPCQTGYDMSNIDLNRFQRPAHMANIVLNRVQYLVNMAAENEFPHGQTEPHGHFRHDMGRYGKRIWIGHYIN